MNIGLFAAELVGNEISSFFGRNAEPLACLVLDSNDLKRINSEIITNSGISDRNRIFYSDSLQTGGTLAALKQMELDLILLAWWPYILKKSILEIPRLGSLNFHPSYLPFNRGKHYNFWSIVEEAPFGVTIHWVDEAVDTGDIAFQSIINKSWEDTGETLYQKAQKELVKLFKERFTDIKEGKIPRISQKKYLGSFHKSEELEKASKIELEKKYKARDLLNLLRARTFPPHPGAWFVENGEKYQIRIQIAKVGCEEDNE